jgi:hypothetical protein
MGTVDTSGHHEDTPRRRCASGTGRGGRSGRILMGGTSLRRCDGDSMRGSRPASRSVVGEVAVRVFSSGSSRLRWMAYGVVALEPSS